VQSMPPQWTSTLLRTGGAIAILGLSFFSTLQILNLMDGPAITDADATFMDVVNALNAGKAVIVQLDDNPAEDRDENGLIACGPDAAKGYLGALIAGERYEVAYAAATRAWSTTGPYQVLRNCGRYSETYGPAKLGSIKAQPENGDLILWGAAMTFDAKLDVSDSTRRKVGHLSIKP
jgi:hypothetical protein